MMKAKWLINLYDEEAAQVAFTCQNLGYETKCAGRYDNMENKPWWQAFGQNDCVVFMGSLQFARDINNARQRIFNPIEWIPGPICDLDFMRYRNYSQYIGEDLLNWPYSIVTPQCFFQMKDHLYETYGNNHCIFVRPDSGFKAFTGQVIDARDFERCYDLFDKYGQGLNELLIVSEPQHIVSEFRLVIVEGKVISGSMYRDQGKIDIARLDDFKTDETLGVFTSLPEKITEFAEGVAKKIPHDVYVMDIALVHFIGPINDMEYTFKVVELNSFSCSGMYACDMKKVVPAVSEWAEKQWREYNDV